MSTKLLAMNGIVKTYGAVRANDGIDFDVAAGEVVGLLGENGSGKSTLMKVLFGTVVPDGGGIVFRDRELSGHAPAEAIAAGVGMVHQHFTLVENMSVAENVMLGWKAAGRWLDRAGVAATVTRISALYGLDVDPRAMVRDLSLGRRQRVEILKCLLRQPSLLIFDEPTSNLSPPEVAALFEVICRLRAEGKAIVFISHKLGEILELCDRVIVLRDGRVVGRRACANATRAELARLMIGRDTTAPLVRQEHASRAPLLEMVGMTTSSTDGAMSLGGVSFTVRAGEVLSIVGVDGNGQAELADTIAGIRSATGGMLRLAGEDITSTSVAARVEAGLSYIPADRLHTSLVPALDIASNLATRDLARPPFSTRGWLDIAGTRAHALRMVEHYGIRTAGITLPAGRLSGGNQQKIVVAREIDRAPRVLVAHQATWGLDPGAARFVLERLLALRDQGAAILYITAELEEGLAIGDRIGVMFGGRIIDVFTRGEAEPTRLGLMMAGAEAA
jgi:simple sugar transport system ATP-binding protein